MPQYMCSNCDTELPFDHALCISGCRLHFGPCSGIQESSWRKGDKSSWKCLSCRKTPNLKDQKPVTAEELREFMLTLNEKLKPIQQIETINETVQELQKSMDFMSGQYDSLLLKVHDMEVERREQNGKIQELKTIMEEKDNSIKTLQARVRECEQYARNRNIEISGLEFSESENLHDIMNNIAQKINVQYCSEDIDIMHRVPSRRKEEPPKVIVQFTTRSVRNHWLKNKKYDTITSDMVTGGRANTTVYLNSHLTQEWKHLLWAAKQKLRPIGYKFVWFSESKIYAKKNEKDRNVIIISSQEDIDKIE
ncbi:Lamin-like protein [Frankliniella fusca]|uniref:Lamin-like protein n=1 Tax=Frankliniella fusca TaxID=407009 RepID=A0AAE1LD66_9NEOP|nr:Lamin-like protein [Frankliniella fusca]